MNAILKFTADRVEYVAANLSRIEQQLAQNVATSGDAAYAAMRDLSVRLALSLQDDAELGRVFRAAFWKEIRDMAKWHAEDEFHRDDEVLDALGYSGPRPVNPVSQSDED